MSAKVEEAAKPADGEIVEAEKGWFAETKEFFKAIAWAFAIAVFLRSFVVEAYKIPSGSMLPTLEVGDHIFVNKFVYGLMVPGTTTKFFMFRHPKRGEVIVFKYPPDVDKDYIKRVIGVPGDKVELRDSVLYVNGVAQAREYMDDIKVVDQYCSMPQDVKLYEEHLGTPGRGGSSRGPGQSGPTIDHAVIQSDAYGKNTPVYVVPEGELFVMGDNRDNSQDSRFWGTVPYRNVKGRAMFVWLSWDPCGKWWPFSRVRGSRFGEGVR